MKKTLAVFTLSLFSSFSYANVPDVNESYCSDSQFVSNWNEMLDYSKDLSTEMKLESVNSFFNIHLSYMEDSNNWKQDNFWATPFESMIKGQGDCEDFAISKFKSLILLGIPEEQLTLHYSELYYGRSETTKVSHMVVVYKDENDNSFVLDNIDSRILPLEERSNLKTLISFNTEQLWVGGDILTDHLPIEKISKWKDTITRFNRQLPFCITS